jgi:hypothetical protein
VSLAVEDPEDAKLLVLARSSRARTRAAEGAAVRDRDGRTYVASSVALTSLQLTALALATAMAVSSGATGLEAAAVVTDAEGLVDDDLAVVRELSGGGIRVWRADATGRPLEVVVT